MSLLIQNYTDNQYNLTKLHKRKNLVLNSPTKILIVVAGMRFFLLFEAKMNIMPFEFTKMYKY